MWALNHGVLNIKTKVPTKSSYYLKVHFCLKYLKGYKAPFISLAVKIMISLHLQPYNPSLYSKRYLLSPACKLLKNDSFVMLARTKWDWWLDSATTVPGYVAMNSSLGGSTFIMPLSCSFVAGRDSVVSPHTQGLFIMTHHNISTVEHS